MSWDGESGWFVVIYYCMGRVIDDVIDGYSSVVIVGGVPSQMMCIEVASYDIVVVVEKLIEKIGNIGVVYVSGGVSRGYVAVSYMYWWFCV